MVFNSFRYLFFLPIVFVIYWSLSRKTKWQNMLLLAASYYFYASWNWKFLFLLIFTTLLDYFSGLQMEKVITEIRRKVWFWISILANIGFLGIFKYYNFFIESFASFMHGFGFNVNANTISVILPVGISFYTFHGLSYVIDVYNRKINAEKDFLNYALFVCYFPLLVAGPIERATHLLPQIKNKRYFSYDKAVDGCRQILWGVFMKVVVADNCAKVADQVFNNYSTHSTVSLVTGVVMFAFQIYGDFAGYSNIALGSSKLLGIDLLKNFSFPYFSRDIAEFWRRWHISLSSWFKDYLYKPLGGSRYGMYYQIRNTLIIFLVSGFWHGANWTFIIWGALNAIYIMPLVIFKLNRKNTNIVAENKFLPSIKEMLQILLTFAITCFAWIFFRSKTLGEAFMFINNIFFNQNFYKKEVSLKPFFFVFIMLIIEWFFRKREFGLQLTSKNYFVFRWLLYFFIIGLIIFFGESSESFIYFQF